MPLICCSILAGVSNAFASDIAVSDTGLNNSLSQETKENISVRDNMVIW
jgi:hypothetical protein